MFNPKASLTYNLLSKLSDRQKKYYPQQFPLATRFFGSLVTSITASLDSVHHLAACVVKVFTGAIATPYQILTQSNQLDKWTWKAASKHFIQACKHLALIVVSPIYTFIFLPNVALHSFFNNNRDETDPIKQNKFLLERITELQSKINELNQKLKQNAENEGGKLAESIRNYQAKIDSLSLKLQVAEGKLGLNAVAITQKDAIIESLKAGKSTAPQPQVYNQILNGKDAQIRTKEEIVTNQSLTIDKLKAENTRFINTINSIAAELICPLTGELFNDPVTLVPCGHRFEKASIAKITANISEINERLSADVEKIKILCPCCRSEFNKMQEDPAVKFSTDRIREMNVLLLEQGKKGIEVLS